MPTATATSSLTSTIQQLEAAYGPQAQSAAKGAVAAYAGALTTLEIISLVITAAFIVGIVIIIRKTGWLRVRLERIDDVILKSNRPKKTAERSWGEVERHFFSGSDSDLKIAVIKADTLLDEALREGGIRGADLGERLRSLTAADLPEIDRIWEAHRLRNRIAHETDFVLKRDLAERALTVYEKALEHLGFLAELPAATETAQGQESNSQPGTPQPPPKNH